MADETTVDQSTCHHWNGAPLALDGEAESIGRYYWKTEWSEAMNMTREQWLAERKNHIGASDVAAILGADPRRGQLAIYEAKVTGYSQEDNDWLAFGRDVEGAISNLYEHRIGRPVIDLGATEICIHDDIPFLGATLDRVTEGTPDNPAPDMSGDAGPLELKHVGDPRMRAADWTEEPPLHYQVQLQTQVACTASAWGSLAGLFPGYQLAYLDMPRDDAFLEAAIPVLETFWDRVQRRDPPPADELPGTLDVVKRMWAAETGETIDLPEHLVGVADEWERAKALARESEKRAKALEGKIRAEMQGATFGALLDGTLLSLKLIRREVKAKDAYVTEFRTLRRVRGKA